MFAAVKAAALDAWAKRAGWDEERPRAESGNSARDREPGLNPMVFSLHPAVRCWGLRAGREAIMGVVIEGASWKARVVATATGLKVSTPAEPSIRRMAEVTDPDDRLFLACRALRRDEDCVEANLVIAAAQEKQETHLCYLHIAVEEGERLWTPVIQTHGDVDLWDIEAARPWLHAVKALGDESLEAGWYDDARDTYGRLLAMDPGAHLSAADSLNRIGPRLVHAI